MSTLVQICPNQSKHFNIGPTCPNWFKLDQIGSNLPKFDQISESLFKLVYNYKTMVEICNTLSKVIQTCPNWLKRFLTFFGFFLFQHFHTNLKINFIG